jgi:4-amino-4-deoxy-L-arabinose transferase-like glycosyltransferase
MSMFTRSWGWALVVGILGAILVVLMTRSVIGHPVHYDELLHMLSARGLIQSGTPVIADGVYSRSELYTRAVAWSFRQFGDSAVSARLPALAAGSFLVFIVGVWMVRTVGLLAGTVAAFLLCLIPATVDVAVFARFYTMHAAATTLVFIAAYEAMRPDRTVPARMLLGGVSLSLVPLAWHFQDTTIIAVGAVAAAVAALVIMDHWPRGWALFRVRPLLTVIVLCLVAIAGVGVVAYLGLLEDLGRSALWAEHSASRFQFYIVEFRKDLPLLWPLLPAAAVIAVVQPSHRRLAVFCAVVVGSALIVHSIAAQKTMRYVYYLAPLMCVLWAIALANLVSTMTRERAVAGEPRVIGASWLAVAVFGAAFVFSQEGSRAINLVAGRVANMERLPFAGEPDWTSSLEILAPRVAAADRVVTSNSVKAIYYLGGYDLELNATIVPETETGSDFGRDPRTGRPAIGKAESIRQVLARPGNTLVVIESSKIGRASGVNSDAFRVIASRCEELELSPGSGVRAWWCVMPVTPEGSASN